MKKPLTPDVMAPKQMKKIILPFPDFFELEEMASALTVSRVFVSDDIAISSLMTIHTSRLIIRRTRRRMVTQRRKGAIALRLCLIDLFGCASSVFTVFQ